MVPVFKSVGERSTAKNYHPVNILSVVSKVFETLVKNRIVDHLEEYDHFFLFPVWFYVFSINCRSFGSCNI